MFVGDLLWPQIVVIRRLDTNAVRVASNYDDDFKEYVLVDSDADGVGEAQRVEKPELKIRAQIATRRYEFADQGFHGQVPDSRDLEITMHFRDLKTMGLTLPDGRSVFVPGDRLLRIEDINTGEKIDEFPDPPGMYLVAARPSGFLGVARNLLVCTFSDRRQDTAAPMPEKRQN